MSATPARPEAVSRPSRTFVIALGLVALVTPLAVHLFFPVIPAVKAALGLTNAHAQFTFSVSLFGMAFATLFYGSLSDRYGRRPVLLSGLGLFLIGSAISLAAETATLLVLGRLVQAIGAGCGLTLVRAIARDAFRAEQLVKAIAYLTMFGTLGPMVSPFIGGVWAGNVTPTSVTVSVRLNAAGVGILLDHRPDGVQIGQHQRAESIGALADEIEFNLTDTVAQIF